MRASVDGPATAPLVFALALALFPVAQGFAPAPVRSRAATWQLRSEKPETQSEESEEVAPVELNLDFLNDDGPSNVFSEAGGDPMAIREAVRRKAAALEETTWKDYSRDEDSDLASSAIDKLPFFEQLKVEFGMVEWPDTKQVQSTSVTVLSLTLFMLLYFAAMRIGTRAVTESIFGEFHDLDLL